MTSTPSSRGRPNLREGALAALRSAILAGELEPDSIQSTTTLAGRLGVSPTPVREAMLELVQHGLVEPLPNRGFRIVPTQVTDLDEIRDLRVMLEVPALALAIETASDEDLAVLRRHIGQIDRAAREGDVQAFITADHTFHLALLSLGENQRLVRIVGELRNLTGAVGPAGAPSRTALKTAGREDRAILEAVIARDVVSAQQRLTRHLDRSRGVWLTRPSATKEP